MKPRLFCSATEEFMPLLSRKPKAKLLRSTQQIYFTYYLKSVLINSALKCCAVALICVLAILR